MRIFCARKGGLSGSEAVYSLLAYAFYEIFGLKLPEIEKTPNGKPYFPSRPDIHFSLSHSKTHVLCAIASVPVGADIESPRVLSRRAINYFAAPEELELFDPLDLWVLKESFIKLEGTTLPEVKKCRFSKVGNTITAAQNPDVVSGLYRVGQCRAAVCSMGEPPPGEIEFLPDFFSDHGTIS